jgi:hypothetical protein
MVSAKHTYGAAVFAICVCIGLSAHAGAAAPAEQMQFLPASSNVEEMGSEPTWDCGRTMFGLQAGVKSCALNECRRQGQAAIAATKQRCQESATPIEAPWPDSSASFQSGRGY